MIKVMRDNVHKICQMTFPSVSEWLRSRKHYGSAKLNIYAKSIIGALRCAPDELNKFFGKSYDFMTKGGEQH